MAPRRAAAEKGVEDMSAILPHGQDPSARTRISSAPTSLATPSGGATKRTFSRCSVVKLAVTDSLPERSRSAWSSILTYCTSSVREMTACRVIWAKTRCPPSAVSTLTTESGMVVCVRASVARVVKASCCWAALRCRLCA